MRIRAMWSGLPLVLVALLAAGCSEAPSRGDLVEALERSGIPTERAECAADAVLDELTEDEVVSLVERGPAGAPRDDPEADSDASDRVRAALAECQQVGEEQAPTTTVADTTTSSVIESTTTTVVEDPGTSAADSTTSTQPDASAEVPTSAPNGSG